MYELLDLIRRLPKSARYIGGVFILILAPAAYYSAELANHYAEIMKKQEREKGQVTPPVPAT